MIYLQKVIAFVKSPNCVDRLEILGRVLYEAGIAFQCLQGDNITDACMKIDLKHDLPAVESGRETRLWITDCAGWARSLRMQGEPVLALLHEDNSRENFEGIPHACENPQELDAEYAERIYRRYVGIPWDITATDRCIIRETIEEDVEAFWEIYQNEQITRYTEGLYPTIEKEKDYVREYREKVYGFLGFGVWTILQKDTLEIIGRAGFSYREGYEEPEIGFVIGVPWQKKGYAYEVCSALLEYGKQELGFEKVQAFVMPDNKASLVLCEKLGMQPVKEVMLNGAKHLLLEKKDYA